MVYKDDLLILFTKIAVKTIKIVDHATNNDLRLGI